MFVRNFKIFVFCAAMCTGLSSAWPLEPPAPDVEPAEEKPSEDPKYYFNLGLEHYDNDEFKSAIDDLTRAIELDPQYASAYYNRNLAWGRLGQVDKAIADCNKAIEFQPNDGWYYSSRGANLRIKGELDKSMADCNRAVELSPKFAWAYMNRGRTWSAMKQVDKAIADYSRAIALDPHLIYVRALRAQAYFDTRNYDASIVDFTEAVRQEPDNTNARKMFAYLRAAAPFQDQRMPDLAVKHAKRACEQTQYQDWFCLFVLATAYGASEDFSNAVKWQKESLANAPRTRQEEMRRHLTSFEKRKPYVFSTPEAATDKAISQLDELVKEISAIE